MTERKQTRPVRFFIDAQRRVMAAVPLTNSDREAILSAEDLAHVKSLGVSTRWFTNDAEGCRFVRCKHRGQTVCVHKLILQPTKRQHVHRLDGDACNMRRENMVVSEGAHCTRECPHRRMASR